MKLSDIALTELQTLANAMAHYSCRNAVRSEITQKHENALWQKLSDEIFDRLRIIEQDRLNYQRSDLGNRGKQ